MQLGGSLPVPAVQELAKETLGAVPPRYIRSDLEDHFSISQANYEIPVIDMQNLLSEEAGDAELTKLHLACKDWGFFQLVNHGIDSTHLDKVKSEVLDFFHLPMSEKKRFWQKPDDIEGFGQTFVVSEEQKLDWSDNFNMMTFPIHKRKPHLFPKLPLPLRDTLELYSQLIKNIGMTIVANVAKVLESEEIVEMFGESMQSMRMNYYPTCPEPEKVVGLIPHSDIAALGILLQLNEVEGLQFKKDGKWCPIKPLPNALIVNVGDQLEIITNGIYRSIEHRAMVNSAQERMSFVTFFMPKYDGQLGPAPSLVTEKTPAKFKTVGVEEHIKGYMARRLYGKSYIETTRIEHSNGK